MELILHIGTEKTGSKALQHFLLNNEKALKEHGCLYPKTYRQGLWHNKIYGGLNQKIADELKAEFEGFRCAFITWEAAYHHTPAQVMERLRSLGESVTILFYVRNHVEWINSAYNQLFKAHRQAVSVINNFSYRLQKFDLNFHLLRWEQFFRPEQMKIVRYEPNSPPYGPVLDIMGIPEIARKQMIYPCENPNRAADLRSIRILYYLKQEIGENNREKLVNAVAIAHRMLSNNWIDTRFAPAPLLLSDDEVRHIQDLYFGSTQEFLRRHGLPKEFVSPVPAMNRASVSGEIRQPTETEIALAKKIIAEVV